MFYKLYTKLKTLGPKRFLHEIYHRIWPARLQYFQDCLPVFEAGVGLEIGGPSSIFGKRGIIPVYPVAHKIDNVNFDFHTIWEGGIKEGETFVFNRHKGAGTQYVCEASNLAGIPDESYDYVLSSHCIEHLANPVLGLTEWNRVLKHDGFMILVVPHKDGTFDHLRPTTKLSHLIDDFELKTGEDDMTHLNEILDLHDLSRDSGVRDFQSFKLRSENNFENRCLHHHVFDTKLVLQLVDYMKLEIQKVELFTPYHIVVVARKRNTADDRDNNDLSRFERLVSVTSPFQSDR